MKLLVDARPIIDRLQGGVSRVALLLVDAYAERFPNDELILGTTGSRAPTLPDILARRPNVKHVHINIPNKFWSASTLIGNSFSSQIERIAGKCDAAFFPNIGFLGSTPRRHGLLIHDLSYFLEPHWFNLRGRMWHKAVRAKYLIQHADHLFAVSERTRQDVIQLLNIPEERVTTIPLGPSLSSTKPTEQRIGPKGRYVLALGWKNDRKNAKTAVQAVEILKRDPAYADLSLAVVGRDIQRPSDAELANLFQNASAFLYPSWYEGYGLPLWEAASYGTPCVSSTAGSLPEVAPKGTFFAHPAKPHQWVEGLKLALPAPREVKTAQPSGWTEAAEKIRSKLIV
jgi:glycosyltransferase involved in cell wall biosynthesis